MKGLMSSVVLYYHWRHDIYIVSIRLLIDHIMKHHKIIPQDVYYCADAFKETKSLSTISKEGRMKEAGRLKTLIDFCISLQSVERKQKCDIAFDLSQDPRDVIAPSCCTACCRSNCCSSCCVCNWTNSVPTSIADLQRCYCSSICRSTCGRYQGIKRCNCSGNLNKSFS